MTDEGLVAGWYPHKDHPDALRYWDGSKWTDSFKAKDDEVSAAHVATTTQVTRGDRATETLAAVGVFAVVLIPLVAFVIGFIVAARNRPIAGIGIVVASVASTWVWWLILFSERS